jgi:hypothetical protein
MTSLVSVPGGLWFPQAHQWMGQYGGVTSFALNATSKGLAYIGIVSIDGGPGTSKTISQAGGGKIYFATQASVVFANAGTTIDVGLQGVTQSNTASPIPDGTFTTKKTLTGGTDTISSTAWNGYAMGTGTKTLNHGDFVAICFIMTARGGSDSVTMRILEWGLLSGNGCVFPLSSSTTNAGSTWSAFQDTPGACLIQFDDGTIGTIHADPMYSQPNLFSADGATSEAFNSSSNPEERGMLFQLPWDCKIDAFYFRATAAASGDMSLILYSDPLGTPVAQQTLTVPAKSWGDASTTAVNMRILASEYQLAKNTNYGLIVKATGSGNITQACWTLWDQTHRALWPGGTNLYKITRHGGSGAFTAEVTKVTYYKMGIRISALPDAAGATDAAMLGGTLVQ